MRFGFRGLLRMSLVGGEPWTFFWAGKGMRVSYFRIAGRPGRGVGMPEAGVLAVVVQGAPVAKSLAAPVLVGSLLMRIRLTQGGRE